MRYPDISFFNDGVNIESIEDTTKLIARCVDSIVIGEEVYTSVDMGPDELSEWLDALTAEQFQKISEFFQTMPKLSTRSLPRTPTLVMTLRLYWRDWQIFSNGDDA
jgi:hypothetical protein